MHMEKPTVADVDTILRQCDESLAICDAALAEAQESMLAVTDLLLRWGADLTEGEPLVSQVLHGLGVSYVQGYTSGRLVSARVKAEASNISHAA